MKSPFFGLLLVALASGAVPAHATDFLTPKEKQEILEGLDTIAGDTWDEGEYEYAFLNVSCSAEASACTIFWRGRYQAEDRFPTGDVRNLDRHPWGPVRGCSFSGVRSAKAVSKAAYGAMDVCITRSRG